MSATFPQYRSPTISLLPRLLLTLATCLLPATAKPQGEDGLPASAANRPNILWLVLEDTSPWAGLEIPSWFEGRHLFAPGHQPREFVASARDRCDQTIDSIR